VYIVVQLSGNTQHQRYKSGTGFLEERALNRYIALYEWTSMSFHPTGITVEIVGIACNTQGRSCEEHSTCGELLEEDTVVRLRKVQIIRDGREESAIAAFHVSDGIDRCRVGFLKRHLLKHWKQYDGVLAQVIEIFSTDSESPTKRSKHHHNKGCCVAAIISELKEEAHPKRSAEPDIETSRRRKRANNNQL
jgi:hypothetical protein